jgi:hypothetical protein
MHAESGGDLEVGAMAVGSVAVAQQEDLGMSDLLSGCVAVASNLIEMIALLGCESDGILIGRE